MSKNTDFNTYLNKSIGYFQKSLLQKKFLRKVLTPEIYELLESYFMLSPVQRQLYSQEYQQPEKTRLINLTAPLLPERGFFSGLTIIPFFHILRQLTLFNL